MKVVLLKDIDNLGVANDIVEVKSGYGRNYLIPQGQAKVASDSNVKHANEIRKQQSAKAQKALEDLQAVAEKLQSNILKIGAKAGANGKLFGSVTNIQIADALKKQADLDLDRRKIKMGDDIKELGTYKATVSLHKEIIVEVEFEVIEE